MAAKRPPPDSPTGTVSLPLFLITLTNLTSISHILIKVEDYGVQTGPMEVLQLPAFRPHLDLFQHPPRCLSISS
jgi:hypothetical protein